MKDRVIYASYTASNVSTNRHFNIGGFSKATVKPADILKLFEDCIDYILVQEVNQDKTMLRELLGLQKNINKASVLSDFFALVKTDKSYFFLSAGMDRKLNYLICILYVKHCLNMNIIGENADKKIISYTNLLVWVKEQLEENFNNQIEKDNSLNIAQTIWQKVTNYNSIIIESYVEEITIEKGAMNFSYLSGNKFQLKLSKFKRYKTWDGFLPEGVSKKLGSRKFLTNTNGHCAFLGIYFMKNLHKVNEENMVARVRVKTKFVQSMSLDKSGKCQASNQMSVYYKENITYYPFIDGHNAVFDVYLKPERMGDFLSITLREMRTKNINSLSLYVCVVIRAQLYHLTCMLITQIGQSNYYKIRIYNSNEESTLYWKTVIDCSAVREDIITEMKDKLQIYMDMPLIVIKAFDNKNSHTWKLDIFDDITDLSGVTFVKDSASADLYISFFEIMIVTNCCVEILKKMLNFLEPHDHGISIKRYNLLAREIIIKYKNDEATMHFIDWLVKSRQADLLLENPSNKTILAIAVEAKRSNNIIEFLETITTERLNNIGVSADYKELI